MLLELLEILRCILPPLVTKISMKLALNQIFFNVFDILNYRTRQLPSD